MKVESAAYKRSRAGANAGRRGNVNVGQQQQPQQAHHGGLVLTNPPPPELATLTPQPPQHHQQQQQHAHIALPTQPYQIHHHHQQQMLLANNPQHKVIRRGHQIEMLQQAKHFCDRQDFVDLTIYCEDGVVRAHQMLLAVASPFLKLLFQSSPLYGIEDICLILPETKACLVQALIHFVYTGTVVSKEDHFYSLMKLVYALSINASIEAESTHERPTAFSAPLVPPQNLERVHRYPHQPLLPTVPHQQHQQLSHLTLQQHHHLQQQQQQQQHQQHQSVSAAAAAAVAAITQPAIAPPSVIPSTKMSRYMTTGPPANALPVPQHALTGQTTKQLPIQLPTQPVPMVNGVTIKNEPHQQHQQQQQQHSYIAIDPNTGLHYKVEVPNGQLTGDLGSDPLAAIMHETIFTETSAGQTTLYTTENGQVIYTTQPAGTVAVNALMGSQSVTQAQMDPNDLSAATLNTSSGAGSGSGTATKRGKKRKQNNKENAVITESVEDLPCAPDDEDLNTPYACAHCNKTIKGRVMLQAHQYQEHYDNPELARIDIGDKHPCRVCLKLFTRNSDVKAHILRVHCGDRRYPCSMCGKRFKESTHLRKHLYTHTGERPHYCTLCDKGFQTSSDLKRHKRTRVHQERVEQLKGGAGEDGTPPGGESAGDASNAEYHSWVDDDEEDEDDGTAVNRRHGKQMKTDAGSNNVASTAQQLLTSITQPVNMVASNGGQSSTIDMKALGGSANVVSAANSASMSVPVTTTSWAAEVVGGGEAGSSASAASAVTSSASGHHYDLKDLTAAAANEVDMATLMHDPNAGGAVDATNHSGAGASMPSIGHHDLQQQQQQLLQQQQQLFSMHDHLGGMAGSGDMNAASTSVGQDLSTSSMKKVDNSPGGGADEEERLTVVEDEESSSNQVAWTWGR